MILSNQIIWLMRENKRNAMKKIGIMNFLSMIIAVLKFVSYLYQYVSFSYFRCTLGCAFACLERGTVANKKV